MHSCSIKGDLQVAEMLIEAVSSSSPQLWCLCDHNYALGFC